MLRLVIIISLFLLVSSDNYNEIYSHLKDMESFCLRGYIPTAESGVTIATGVDLGQSDSQKLLKMKVPKNIVDKLKPYLGKKTKAEVHNSHLNEEDLVLTKDEASQLDKPFLQGNIKDLTPYFGRLSAKGQAVLVSVRHWAWRLFNKQGDNKLSVKVNGKVVSYVYDAVKSNKATDSDLLNALKKTEKAVTGNAKKRLDREIAYLDGSAKTPSKDYCYLCTTLKKQNYCY